VPSPSVNSRTYPTVWSLAGLVFDVSVMREIVPEIATCDQDRGHQRRSASRASMCRSAAIINCIAGRAMGLRWRGQRPSVQASCVGELNPRNQLGNRLADRR
jgi:hypothetical protein